VGVCLEGRLEAAVGITRSIKCILKVRGKIKKVAYRSKKVAYKIIKSSVHHT